MSYILKGSDDKPILRNDKEVHAQDLTGVVKAINLEKRTLSIIGTDETRDRDGDIIRVNGWVLENYLKNPVFLWAHNYSSVPLGATSQIVRRRNPSRLEFKDIRFPTEGLNPFADMILHLFNEKIINASSVGFLPYQWKDLEKSEDTENEPPGWKWGKEFTKQELLELSGCPVPSNPAALQNFVKGFAGSEILTQNLINCFNSGGLEELDTKDDILEELNVKSAIDIIDEDRPVQVQVGENLEVEEVGDVIEVKVKEEVKEEISPEEIHREYYKERFGIESLEGNDYTVIQTETLDIEGCETIVSYLKLNEGGELQIFKQETIDAEESIPDKVGETLTMNLSLSQEDKEWIALTIKEALQTKEVVVVTPEVKTETQGNSEMQNFLAELAKLKKVSDEIKEVVQNAAH